MKKELSLVATAAILLSPFASASPSLAAPATDITVSRSYEMGQCVDPMVTSDKDISNLVYVINGETTKIEFEDGSYEHTVHGEVTEIWVKSGNNKGGERGNGTRRTARGRYLYVRRGRSDLLIKPYRDHGNESPGAFVARVTYLPLDSACRRRGTPSTHRRYRGRITLANRLGCRRPCPCRRCILPMRGPSDLAGARACTSFRAALSGGALGPVGCGRVKAFRVGPVELRGASVDCPWAFRPLF